MNSIELKMSEYSNFANPIGARLKAEMKKRGFTSTELARRADVLTSFLYDIISGKSSNPSTVKLAKVAEALGVSLTYLVSGTGTSYPETNITESNKLANIPFIVSKNNMDISNNATMKAPYYFNKEWIKNNLATEENNLNLFTVQGDAMQPTLSNQDVLLVDTNQHIPSPPGIFVIHDGFGLSCKRIEYFTEANDTRIRVISDNLKYSRYECSISDVTIIGRVVWFSRKI